MGLAEDVGDHTSRSLQAPNPKLLYLACRLSFFLEKVKMQRLSSFYNTSVAKEKDGDIIDIGANS